VLAWLLYEKLFTRACAQYRLVDVDLRAPAGFLAIMRADQRSDATDFTSSSVSARNLSGASAPRSVPRRE
jgi:hypothetical protein